MISESSVDKRQRDGQKKGYRRMDGRTKQRNTVDGPVWRRYRVRPPQALDYGVIG